MVLRLAHGSCQLSGSDGSRQMRQVLFAICPRPSASLPPELMSEIPWVAFGIPLDSWSI